MLAKILSVAVILISGVGVGRAAEIKVDHDSSSDIIEIRGEIVSGDANRLKKAIAQAAPNIRLDSLYDLTISINSPGGDVKEAVSMGNIVRQSLVSVSVEGGGVCASACFFVWLAGVPHFAASSEQMKFWIKTYKKWDDTLGEGNEMTNALRNGLGKAVGGPVGLHRPFLANIQSVENDQDKVMKIVRAYLDDQLVPRRLVDTMLSRPSNDIYWLTRADLDELGEYPPDVEEYLINKCGYKRDSSGMSSSEVEKMVACTLYDLRRSRRLHLERK